jgi:RNA polymerase sigma-70 factor (ECF subfamily)
LAPPPHDPELNRRFIAGEERAVREVYAEFGGPVTTVAASILKDRDHVGEAVQQTFLKAWRAAATFDPARELGPWLYSIARRTSIDIYRRERTRAGEPLADHDEGISPLSFERTWEAYEVRRAVERLPDEERQVVRLSHFEGLSHTEIAERLGVPAGTVKSRSYRAHRRLAAWLGYLSEEPD